MLTRRQLLGGLAASMALRPLEALAASRPQPVPNLRWPDIPVHPPLSQPFSPTAIGRILRQRYSDLRQHFIFEYYPWYGTAPWRHWNQWDRRPPSDIAVTSVPALGPYDSRDSRVLEQHATWIAESGVGAINISWWGQGSYEDRAVPLVMDVMADHGIKVTFHLEPYADTRADRYANDIRYLITQYGDKRRWDAMLVLRDASGDEGPVFKSFATILPQTSTDCHGHTFPVSLYRPDGAWRQQTDSVRGTFLRDFDHIHLLADSGSLDHVRASGFDGIAIYDSFFKPSEWPALAQYCRDYGLLFSFAINVGFDGIAQRNVAPDACYSAPPFEPPATLDFSTAVDREWAKLYAERRIDDSMSTTLSLQNAQSLPNASSGFFLTYITTFNEWHEGTAFEPMKDHADLTADELPFGYHNPTDGHYRLEHLTARMTALLQA